MPPKANDFVIFDPWQSTLLDHPDIEYAQYYLGIITSNPENDIFSFEILDYGSCALVEALAISACRNGQRIWTPYRSFGDSNQ